MPNSLDDWIRRQIKAHGPMGVTDYMAAALGHPEFGYYTTRDPFGSTGDFITAPEISQMFGELIGMWCAQLWIDQGRPTPVSLIELGPGRGTLMADLLRALKVVPTLQEGLEVHLVETSPTLIARQKETLDAKALTGAVHWHTSLSEALSAGHGMMLCVANEFFDALPIRQMQWTGAAWHERMVGLDKDDRLAFVLSPDALPDAVGARRGPGTASLGREPGAILERCPAGEAIMADLGGALAERGGGALIIDYGYVLPPDGPSSGTAAWGDTLQAVRAHGHHDVLEDPGSADLTAHVDFTALAEAARDAGAQPHGPVHQGALLEHLGIGARAQTLMKNASEDQKAAIEAARTRLTAADSMGTLFKALALTASNSPVPPGFPLPAPQTTESVRP